MDGSAPSACCRSAAPPAIAARPATSAPPWRRGRLATAPTDPAIGPWHPPPAGRMGCLKGGVVANVVVPAPGYVAFAAHYGFRPDFCEAADPESKGLVEALVGYAKRDLVVAGGPRPRPPPAGPGAPRPGPPGARLPIARPAVPVRSLAAYATESVR